MTRLFSLFLLVALSAPAHADMGSWYSGDLHGYIGVNQNLDVNMRLMAPWCQPVYDNAGVIVPVSTTHPLPTTGGGGGGGGVNTAGQINNNAAVTTTASTFTVPTNAVGFILEAESSNTANVRWAVGSTATASIGTIAEPGRDTGYVPLAASISVIATSGTQAVSVQWILSQ